jgi:ribosome recycling factor
MDASDVLSEMEGSIKKTVESLEKELSRVRTGRASVSILDSVRVDYYGTKTPLNQCASLSTPEPRLIVVRPWDKTMAGEIEKAILAANLGLTPMSDGEIIRIPIPPLTEERRRELVKLIKRYGEDHKVSVRNSRRDSNEMLKEMEKEGEISEDESKKAVRQVQEITDQGVKRVDEVIAEKEKEIMEG